MYIIQDVSGRMHHTRWSVSIPKNETKVDNLCVFFKQDPKVRSEENIFKNLDDDPNVKIHKVKKAKEVKNEKPKVDK